jgi:hypothetical protein
MVRSRQKLQVYKRAFLRLGFWGHIISIIQQGIITFIKSSVFLCRKRKVIQASGMERPVINDYRRNQGVMVVAYPVPSYAIKVATVAHIFYHIILITFYYNLK